MGFRPLVRKASVLYLADGYLALVDTPVASPAHMRQPEHVGRCSRPDLTRRRLKTAFSVFIFCLTVSFIPIYNKKVFAGAAGVQRFPYPLAIAFLQLGLVASCLGLASTAAHLLLPPLAPRSRGGLPLERSWLFGPHFCYKVRHAAPAGLCFGLKYAVTNWGLQLVPTGTHLLLQATDLLWTVALARLVNHEHVGPTEALAALLSTAGTAMVSTDAAQQLSAPLLPILVNLLTPLFLGLSVTTLRSGVNELMQPRGRLGGTMAVAEFTSIKLTVSSLTCLVASCVLEGGVIGLSKHTGVHRTHKPAWWVALAAYPAHGTALILLGGVFILVFQVNITWLTRLTSAVTVGMVGGVKVVPQWILNSAFGVGHAHSTPLSAIGALLVLAASGLYLRAQLQPHDAANVPPMHVGLLWCGDSRRTSVCEERPACRDSRRTSLCEEAPPAQDVAAVLTWRASSET